MTIPKKKRRVFSRDGNEYEYCITTPGGDTLLYIKNIITKVQYEELYDGHMTVTPKEISRIIDKKGM